VQACRPIFLEVSVERAEPALLNFSCCRKVYSGLGADVVYEIVALKIREWRRRNRGKLVLRPVGVEKLIPASNVALPIQVHDMAGESPG
jgi:hypothetical protein